MSMKMQAKVKQNQNLCEENVNDENDDNGDNDENNNDCDKSTFFFFTLME